MEGNKFVGIAKWRALDGDNTLALNWDLNENSHVWEIGGFEGRWAQQIWDKFHCNITIFEPQDWAYKRLSERFAGNLKIHIRPYGLWTQDGTMRMGNFETDGASIVNNEREPIFTIGVKEICNEIDQFKVHHGQIDLALMNIEGAEFELLPRMISSGRMESFRQFWCQFHPGLIYDGDGVAWDIVMGMNKTHDVLWECYPTAVAWSRRD